MKKIFLVLMFLCFVCADAFAANVEYWSDGQIRSIGGENVEYWGDGTIRSIGE